MTAAIHRLPPPEVEGEFDDEPAYYCECGWQGDEPRNLLAGDESVSVCPVCGRSLSLIGG